MTEDNSSPSVPLSEKLKGIPGIFGIRLGEEELYSTLQTEGEIEIRKYVPLILASITVQGDFEQASKQAFLSLSNYIFGHNKDNKKLQMLVPVLQEMNLNDWTMSFIMPLKYSLTTIPTPINKNIHLHKYPERLVATLKYSGTNTEDKIQDYSTELIDWLSNNQEYTPVGEIQCAQYDSASTISFLRKNEIHIEVRAHH
jgi:hypothetical protein